MNALNAYNKLNANVAGLKKSSEKLSSGYRINRAGDDAAGLAISEKMRSQIRGLNQAVRNSQDGINMIQTFEGAAQETHSILQRMKELASESANGTYDNATDRAAIQLEFDQLNDELNQIADTDFNGTIVLNGGQMADGLKAENGEFNYKNEYDKLMTAIENAKNATDVTKYDGENAGAILDNSDYDYKSANALWEALGLDPKDVQDLNITFVKNGDNWEAKAVSGRTMTDAGTPATIKEYNITAEDDDAAEQTGTMSVDDYNAWKAGADYYIHNTGDINTTSTGTAAKALDDTAKVEAVYNDDAVDPTYEETDITDKVNAFLKNLTITTNDSEDATGKGGFTVSWSDKDGNTYDVNAVFGAYASKDGDFLTLNFKNTDETTYAPDNIGVNEDSLTVTVAADGGETRSVVPEGTISITLDDSVLNDESMNAAVKKALDNLANATFTFTAGDTDSITAAGDGAKAADADLADAGDFKVDADGNIVIWNGEEEVTIGTITVDKTKIDGIANDDTIEFDLNIDDYNLANYDNIKANSIETSDLLKEALTPTGTAANGVTKPNAFDKSTAILTYTDNITLQTGSRTKDAVNFSFQYNTDGTADMGDLKANLNLSAREDGLNTANLSLASQESANYAIDQIDKAINKTSMVRATFGAIQNRLEHKITNLTTTSENLQEAESSIRDTDMAQEMMNYTKYNILQQAAQSMLAQANQQPQSILQLLG